MRKNGFTLIELLAVIVILAIIALIATPIILGIINDARKESYERSIDLYASAIRNGIAAYQLREMKEVKAGSYTSETLPFDVEYSGDVVCTAIELYEDGGVYIAGCTVNDIEVDYTYGAKQQQIYKTYKNGDVVYYDVDDGVECEDLYTEAQSNTGVKTGCMKFYAFGDSESRDTVNLLLDHNTTATISTWKPNVDNTSDSSEFLTQLKTDTNSWVGTETPTNYLLDESTTIETKYTIDYSGYKARIISAEEVAQITGNTSWYPSKNFYFDSNTTIQSDTCYRKYDSSTKTYISDISGCKYGWLYDRTSTGCTANGCLNNSDVSISGYWTVSFNAPNLNYVVWYVTSGARFRSAYDVDNHTYGVRPVITVLKSRLQ